MESWPPDLLGLTRGILVGTGTGLLVGLIMRKAGRLRWGGVIAASIAVVLIVTVVVSLAWPSLAEVPDLKQLSRAEAERILLANDLNPQARPLRAPGIESGRVVPGSQDPQPHLKVARCTAVTFAVSAGREMGNPPRATAPGFMPRSSVQGVEIRFIAADMGMASTGSMSSGLREGESPTTDCSCGSERSIHLRKIRDGICNVPLSAVSARSGRIAPGPVLRRLEARSGLPTKETSLTQPYLSLVLRQPRLFWPRPVRSPRRTFRVSLLTSRRESRSV
jgi:hypothetical protein